MVQDVTNLATTIQPEKQTQNTTDDSSDSEESDFMEDSNTCDQEMISTEVITDTQ